MGDGGGRYSVYAAAAKMLSLTFLKPMVKNHQVESVSTSP